MKKIQRDKTNNNLLISSEHFERGNYEIVSFKNVVDTEHGELNTNFFEHEINKNKDGMFEYKGQLVGNLKSRPKKVYGVKYVSLVSVNNHVYKHSDNDAFYKRFPEKQDYYRVVGLSDALPNGEFGDMFITKKQYELIMRLQYENKDVFYYRLMEEKWQEN